MHVCSQETIPANNFDHSKQIVLPPRKLRWQLIGDTYSNSWFSIVMLVFGGNLNGRYHYQQHHPKRARETLLRQCNTSYLLHQLEPNRNPAAFVRIHCQTWCFHSWTKLFHKRHEAKPSTNPWAVYLGIYLPSCSLTPSELIHSGWPKFIHPRNLTYIPLQIQKWWALENLYLTAKHGIILNIYPSNFRKISLHLLRNIDPVRPFIDVGSTSNMSKPYDIPLYWLVPDGIPIMAYYTPYNIPKYTTG